MDNKEILKIFEQTGALLTGHFLLTSGLHSEQYFQCAKVLQYPDIAADLCSQLATSFSDKKISAVIAPAIGGIVVGHEVARALGVRAIFAERAEGKMELRRGFAIEKDEPILVVEDVVTTGGSVKEVIALVQESGGRPVGVGCLVDRSQGTVDFGLEFHPLVSLHVKTVSPETCHLCKQNIPVVKPGSRAGAATN